MSPARVLGGLRGIAATGTALLPVRRRSLPGSAPLVPAPVPIGVLAAGHGARLAAAAARAVVAIFRPSRAHPGRKALGRGEAGE